MVSFQKYFKTIFNHSPFGMVIMDRSERILHANRTFLSMVDLQETELPNSRISHFLHPEDADDFQERFRVICTGGTGHFQTAARFGGVEDDPAWWRMDITSVQQDAEEPLIFGVVDDITEQRTSQTKLTRAKESAERATKTKSAFLANMSHEIRTPIHTIMGMSELLRETKLDEEQQEYTSQVQFASEVLLGLINDILDFSKIEAGKFTLELIEFDLYAVTEDAVDMVSLEAHKKGLEVVLDLDPNIPRTVIGDPARLRQIVVNLFNNAVKFTNTGEIVICASLESDEDQTATVQFRVQDTGIGINADKLAQLFQSFTQVDSSTSRKYGGTGLGLSICKNLVHLMGGEIGVESRERNGSTFWFRVPFKYEDRHAMTDELQLDACREHRILVVDDNTTARSVLRRYLEIWCPSIDEAENGTEALERLRGAMQEGRPYDIALIDLTMPGIDGWQLASEVNADKEINSTALMLMSPTGSMGGEAKMKLLKWFNAYVAKPVKWSELFDAIGTVLKTEIELEGADEDDEDIGELEPVEEVTQHVVTRAARIVVAEDHIVNQQLFRTILTKMGYEVILANNGREAVETVTEDQPDLIFMDVQMPEMNGYEATEALRKSGVSVPVIAVTANAVKGERDKCIDAGMDDFLSKPFKSHDLKPLLEKYLPANGRVAETAVASPPEEPEGARVFEYRKALEAFMGKSEVLHRVIGAFRDRLDRQLDTIQRALTEGDLDQVRAEAHAIKGGAWSLEAMPLGDAAADLEEAARAQDADACRRGTQALAAAAKAFHEYCDGPSELQ